MSWPFMAAGGLLWMLAAVLVVVGVVALIVWAIGATQGRRAGDDAIEILRARYASGEIDDERFAKVRETLGPSERRRRSRGGLLLGAGFLLVGLILGIVAWASFGGFRGMMGFGMMGMMGPGPTAPAGTSVTMAGARFTPETITISTGESVRWFNDDAMPHTATAADRSWDSGNLPPGGSLRAPLWYGRDLLLRVPLSRVTATVVVSGS